MLTWIDWLMIFGYFGVLAGVVVFSLRRNKIESGEDLFLGGRSVGWLAIGASIFAANIGSEHLIGLAGSGAVAGLSQSHWEFHAWVPRVGARNDELGVSSVLLQFRRVDHAGVP